VNDTQAYCRESEYFSASVRDRICTIEIKNCSMLAVTDLKIRDEMGRYLDCVSNSRTVKVVVILSHHSHSCCEDYVAFYDRVYQSKLRQGDLLRACRSLDQIMLKIVSSPKFFIGVNSGKLFPEAFCWDLACDYRMISEDTTFQNVCLDYEITPKGGVLYFLEKSIGRTNTALLLLSEDTLASDQALSMGLVNKVVPGKQLEAAMRGVAQYYARQPAATIAGIKKMLNYFNKDLEAYLEFETQALVSVLRKKIHPIVA
jgi:2-(1,2-epoxy-1,2-dihydrophenyl)acetyl-CoA isomerase